ncbi:MAG TPA: hypothetical protein VFE51_15425 [Verrucomicrobiae bacterium]|nr:hypothetical protein [Verrucomicrobiae bacterium]
MRTLILVGFALVCARFVGLSAELAPVQDILLPRDIVQDSIRIFTMGHSRFAVFFTYTESGATNMLAFNEAQAGQRVQTRVGDYLCPVAICYKPRDLAEYERWKQGWLKRRTSKFIVDGEDEAQKLTAALKGDRDK